MNIFKFPFTITKLFTLSEELILIWGKASPQHFQMLLLTKLNIKYFKGSPFFN